VEVRLVVCLAVPGALLFSPVLEPLEVLRPVVLRELLWEGH
jgi:hypothetical protein